MSNFAVPSYAVLLAALLLAAAPLQAQEPAAPGLDALPPAIDEEPSKSAAPRRIEVRPETADEEIRARLERILETTGGFVDVEVEVREGVVVLAGLAEDERYRKLAGELAQSIQDVVLVDNRIELVEPSAFDFGPALSALRELWRDIIQSLPLLGFAMLVLALAWAAALLAISGLRSALKPKMQTRLLREVVARAGGVLVFLMGLYIVLYVSGLTRLALTVVGGTGLLGLIIGIAFRDITENFLASIFLSLQNPFRAGDLVEITGLLGVVQQVNARTTVIMTLDGNHAQIPNATVYKNTILNFTSNPNRREQFTIGIGYEDSIPRAQEVALQVLTNHPAVLGSPEPWVLVDNLGPSSVSLKIYFWLDGSQHSWLKVRSSVIRLVKRAFQDHGISMPDEAREVVFPHGVPVQLTRDRQRAEQGDGRPPARPQPPAEAVATTAEGELKSETEQIQEQARHSRTPEEGQNLLTPSAPQ